MLHLEDIKPGLALEGVEPFRVVTVEFVKALTPDSIQVFYRPPEGGVKECNLTRMNEGDLRLATQERPWAFDETARRSSWRWRPSASTSHSCSTR